jgi:hypothetical protein
VWVDGKRSEILAKISAVEIFALKFLQLKSWRKPRDVRRIRISRAAFLHLDAVLYPGVTGEGKPWRCAFIRLQGFLHSRKCGARVV